MSFGVRACAMVRVGVAGDNFVVHYVTQRRCSVQIQLRNKRLINNHFRFVVVIGYLLNSEDIK